MQKWNIWDTVGEGLKEGRKEGRTEGGLLYNRRHLRFEEIYDERNRELRWVHRGLPGYNAVSCLLLD